ncbi:Ulp1 family isopeptidase [Bradyrhizobium mercantei]
MAQQQNRYDCGVFVLDATRTLVRRWRKDSSQSSCALTTSAQIGRPCGID